MQSFQKLQNDLKQYLSNELRPECESAKNKERKEEEEVKGLCNSKATVNNAFRFKLHYYGETREAKICGFVCSNFRELN